METLSLYFSWADDAHSISSRKRVVGLCSLKSTFPTPLDRSPYTSTIELATTRFYVPYPFQLYQFCRNFGTGPASTTMASDSPPLRFPLSLTPTRAFLLTDRRHSRLRSLPCRSPTCSTPSVSGRLSRHRSCPFRKRSMPFSRLRKFFNYQQFFLYLIKEKGKYASNHPVSNPKPLFPNISLIPLHYQVHNNNKTWRS